MATWKRLTDIEDVKVDVNLDAVAYIEEGEDSTMLMFAGGSNEQPLRIYVQEKPDQIHMAKALRSTE